MQTTPYLYFKGDCEAALVFYEACGLGKVTELRRFAGTAVAERDGGAFKQQFWGDHYGNCMDKFGVPWAVTSRPVAAG